MSRLVGLIVKDDLLLPSDEIAVQRELWRATLLRVIRTLTALVSVLGLATIFLLMDYRQRLVPVAGLCTLLVVSLFPKLPNRMRAWLLTLALPGMCILAIPTFGLSPNIVTGLLVSVCMAIVLLGRREAAAACTLIGLGLLAVCVSLMAGWCRVPPWWSMVLDPNRPGNVARIALIFLLAATALGLCFTHVLRRMERLLFERTAALSALKAEAAAKEKLRREVANQEKLQTHVRELEQMGRLANYFGHDANNALQVVSSSLEILKDEMADRSERFEALAALENAAAQIRSMASQLRAFGPSRNMGSGSADLVDVFEHIQRMLKQILPRGISVKVGQAVAAKVAMAETELQRILTNLALNARDAMPERGVLVIASRAARPEELAGIADPQNPCVAIEVRDTGTGIPPGLRDRIFEPYFTTKGRQGSGLGLASVRQSVELCKGRIKVESETGLGTTFTILLPVFKASPSQEMTRETALSPAPVLVAEAPLVQKAIIRALGSRGIAALAVDSVEAGLELLLKSTESFPMFVLGGLPMTDVQALIRAYHGKNPSGEVVFCADDEMELDAGNGPITTLLKPFTLPELLQAVEACLATVAPASRQDPANARDA